MKRFIISSFFILCAAPLFAELPKQFQPSPNTYISEAIYSSTNTGVVTSSQAVVISSRPCAIHTINILTAGASGSKLEIFNTNTSTSNKNGDLTDLQKIGPIDTSSAQRPDLYDVYFDSGMAIYLDGTTPAVINITYRQK